MLPHYGNTHTTTSLTGAQSTCFRHEARQLIAQACNARVTGRAADDVVLFCGAGATGAVATLVRALELHRPWPRLLPERAYGEEDDAADAAADDDDGAADDATRADADAEEEEEEEEDDDERAAAAADVLRPIVFVGPFEHHSNLLPWRESCARVVPIALDAATGRADLADLEVH